MAFASRKSDKLLFLPCGNFPFVCYNFCICLRRYGKSERNAKDKPILYLLPNGKSREDQDSFAELVILKSFVLDVFFGNLY